MSKMNPQRKYNTWNTCSRHAVQNKSEKNKVKDLEYFSQRFYKLNSEMALNKLHGFKLLTMQLQTTEEYGSSGVPCLQEDECVWRNTQRRAETIRYCLTVGHDLLSVPWTPSNLFFRTRILDGLTKPFCTEKLWRQLLAGTENNTYMSPHCT